MGYKPRSTIYTLDFDGTDWDGLEVRMRATKLGNLFGSAGILGIVEKIGRNSLPSSEEMALALSQYEVIAEHLVSWNIDADDDSPLPATLDGLKTLEVPLVMAISNTWQAAMQDVAPPLPAGSSVGLPDVPLPMASIPASLASLSMPN